jgi:hypothetical protein
MGLSWHEAQSADRDHQDVEVDLATVGCPGGAQWAYVAAEGDGGPFIWRVFKHWLWDDIDNDPDVELAGGTAASMDEGKGAVEEWARSHT